MMLAWAFSCRTADEVAALVRALGKHRYVRDVDHRIHWVVDEALAPSEPFATRAREFERRRAAEPDLDPASYDPRLWRAASADEVAAVFEIFWQPSPARDLAVERLFELVGELGLPPPLHEAFEGDPEFPEHPQLVQLSWSLFPVDELDPERHAGAVGAMEAAAEEVDPSALVSHEGPDLGVAELVAGAPRGVLVGDFLVWADGPYAYNDYVFRGASKLAKLPDPPEGYRDI